MKQNSNEYLQRFGKRRNRLIRFTVGLFLVSAAFLGGFLVRGNVELLTYLGFDTLANDPDSNPGMTVSDDTAFSLAARVAEVEGVLNNNSLDSFDMNAATTDVMGVLASSTNDPFVSYLDQEHYETYLSAANDSYRGIGVLFSENNGRAYAVDVFSSSQAEAAGVRPGDFIAAIDGDRGGDGWTQAEVVRAIGNSENESVVITWRRPPSATAEGGEEFNTELSVSSYSEPNVKVDIIDEEVGYIKLSQITSNSAQLVKSAIKNLSDAGATSYVLDLRDNPGGYLSQAIDIGSLFLPSGTFVEIVTKDSTLNREASEAVQTTAPVVVLINSKTAAAAEVLAGGLQDYDKPVVGETSMGKGSVQSVTQLSFGGGIRYTSAYYKTPKGHVIDGNGINPDIQVAASGSSSSEDPQRSLAVDTAKSMVAKQ